MARTERSLAQVLIDLCLENGIEAAGLFDLNSEAFEKGLNQAMTVYDDWLGKGFMGEMNYLVRGRDRRANPKLVFNEAQSALCILVPYPAQSPHGSNPGDALPKYARYLRGNDYHQTIKDLLEKILTSASHEFSMKWKTCVDTSAVLERSFAVLAGLGWVGKNGMLIHPKLGSFTFIGVALINQPVGVNPEIMSPLCGHCTACLSGCPTSAIKTQSSGVAAIDSNLCISYLTLEKKTPHSNDVPTERMGTWLAGCDICQDVCPFNFKPIKKADSNTITPGHPYLFDWDELKNETKEQYVARVRGTALDRISFEQARRNLEVASKNGERR